MQPLPPKLADPVPNQADGHLLQQALKEASELPIHWSSLARVLRRAFRNLSLRSVLPSTLFFRSQTTAVFARSCYLDKPLADIGSCCAHLASASVARVRFEGCADGTHPSHPVSPPKQFSDDAPNWKCFQATGATFNNKQYSYDSPNSVLNPAKMLDKKGRLRESAIN